MTPEFKLDTSRFKIAMRQYLLETSRELPAALNARMFYLLLRVYALLRPASPQARRQQIKAELEDIVETRSRVTKSGKVKRLGRSRQLRRVHLIVQGMRGKMGLPGLYGAEMAKAVARFRRARVGSVGYLKAAVVRAISIVQRAQGYGSFTQFGRGGKNPKRRTSPNAALLKVAGGYGIDMSAGNVAVFRSAKATGKVAVPGFDPRVTIELDVGVANDQLSNVGAEYTRAFAKAYADETTELENHLVARAQAIADNYNA